MSGGWGWAWDGEGGGIIGIGQGAAFVPSDVPQSEADALIAFYDATNGDSWTNNTGWKSDPVVGNWYGVTVSGGHVTQLGLSVSNVAGAAGDTLAPLATHLTKLELNVNSLTTLDVSALTALTYLNVGSNPSLATLDLSALTALNWFNCYGCSVASLDLSSVATGVTLISCKNNGMAQAAVDSIIDDIWQRRADFTDPTPELRISGTNAAPTGTYQNGYPEPLDALEKIHDLINDDAGAGIQTWAYIEWTGGSAP